MNFFSTVKLVLRTLLARKGRSFLTILGIVIGVAGVIIIIALGAGAQSLVLSQVTKLGTNLIGVLPGKSNETGPPAAVFGVQVTTLTNDDVEAMKDKTRAPHITALAAFARGSGAVLWQNKDIDTFYSGTQASYTLVQNAEVEQGRFFDEAEERAGANVAVLGFTVKEELFGEADPIGQVIKINTLTSLGLGSVPFRVVGVMAKQGNAGFQNQDDQVFIPLIVAQQQLLGIRYLQFIRAKVDSAENVKAAIADVSQLLMERHRIKNQGDIDFSVRDLADAIKVLTGITNALRLFLVAMAGIALLVGGIGIMNIMLVTVAERTREIGLRKAVGASNQAVRNQFLLEAGSLTCLGGFLGIILGSLIAYLAALGARYAGYEWAFVISPLSIILAVGVSILTGVIFGLYPAFKAAKLNPIDALRYE